MDGLRWWRRARGLTQEQLAALSGVDRSHISKIECGEIFEPRPDTLCRLADALGVDVLALILGEVSIRLRNPNGGNGCDHTETTPLLHRQEDISLTEHPRSPQGRQR